MSWNNIIIFNYLVIFKARNFSIRIKHISSYAISSQDLTDLAVTIDNIIIICLRTYYPSLFSYKGSNLYRGLHIMLGISTYASDYIFRCNSCLAGNPSSFIILKSNAITISGYPIFTNYIVKAVKGNRRDKPIVSILIINITQHIFVDPKSFINLSA